MLYTIRKHGWALEHHPHYYIFNTLKEGDFPSNAVKYYNKIALER